ncbi:Transmembrane protein [Fasciola gigantica]|uniref:GDT1 family protein n=1 Tax=Fasciola gigantica TaxID=46835 RepID=A0A504Z7B3_FASGI|nr:Transmembrane protein [Fasciola gigantica]
MAMQSIRGLFFFSTVALVLVFASSISKVENVEQLHHGEAVRKVHEEGEAVPQQFWDRFFNGFYASLYVIIISELGDKTFFIAAIMSMQHSRCLVYSGAMGALATMTILSAMLGYATTVVPRKLTYYTSGILFLLFGLKMLYDGILDI